MWTLVVWLAPVLVLAGLVAGADPTAVAQVHHLVAQVHLLRSCLSAPTPSGCAG